MNRIKIPGKLFIAGEYQILNNCKIENIAIVTSVNRYVDFVYCESKKLIINEKQEKIKFNQQEKYIESIINYCREIFKTRKNLEIYYKDNLKVANGKLGLGSSSAIIVAIVKMYAKMTNKKLAKYQEYLISSYLNTKISINNSCGDIAGNIANGVIYVSNFGGHIIHRHINIEQLLEVVLYETEYKNGIIYFKNFKHRIVFALTKFGAKTKVSYLYTNVEANSRKAVSRYQKSENFTYIQDPNLILNLITNSEINVELFDKIAKQYHDFLEKILAPQLVDFQKITLQILDRVGCHYKISGSGGGDCIILINLTKKQEIALKKLAFLVETINYKLLKFEGEKEQIINQYLNEL